MIILAATPGPGILLVTSQTVSNNLRAGFLTTIGIILADIFFILLVSYGLSTLVKSLESLTTIISLFGGLYLIFLGAMSFKKTYSRHQKEYNKKTPLQKSYFQFLLSGFLITLSNPKAILFYLSFLPAFVDLTRLKHIDVVIIIATAIMTITPTLMFYAWMSHQAIKISQRQRSRQATKLSWKNIISKISAILIMAVGSYMLYRTTL